MRRKNCCWKKWLRTVRISLPQRPLLWPMNAVWGFLCLTHHWCDSWTLREDPSASHTTVVTHERCVRIPLPHTPLLWLTCGSWGQSTGGSVVDPPSQQMSCADYRLWMHAVRMPAPNKALLCWQTSSTSSLEMRDALTGNCVSVWYCSSCYLNGDINQER